MWPTSVEIVIIVQGILSLALKVETCHLSGERFTASITAQTRRPGREMHNPDRVRQYFTEFFFALIINYPSTRIVSSERFPPSPRYAFASVEFLVFSFPSTHKPNDLH